jgi:pimeloyl-ACP methyl ester carboxylesterase
MVGDAYAIGGELMGKISPSLRRDGAIGLPDGRRLAYAEWGTPSGSPVFLFHGTPGSRLFCPDYETTMSSGVRLITVDRPGYGRSDPKRGRTLFDWTDDVARLADALEVDDFAVVGVSGGAAYALACGVKLRERVTRVGIAAGAGGSFDEAPHLFDERSTALALAAREDLSKAENAAMTDAFVLALAERPESLFQEEETPEADMWLFRDIETLREFEDVVREGMRQGPVGVALDWVTLVAPWGFKLADIPVHVHVWHGEHDHLVKRDAVDLMAEQVRSVEVTTWPHDGHLGLMTHWADVVAALRP